MEEDYEQERPEKDIFSQPRQKAILKQVREFVKDDLLPNPKINKIILFGSLAEGKFGRYKQEYKGRIYSYIDILLLVDNDFEVPDSWELHFAGDPEFEGDLYQVYNQKKLESKYLMQYMVCREKSYRREENREVAEKWGVPLKLEESEHEHQVIYEA